MGIRIETAVQETAHYMYAARLYDVVRQVLRDAQIFFSKKIQSGVTCVVMMLNGSTSSCTSEVQPFNIATTW